MKMIYVDLVLEGGELIRIQGPEQLEDKIHEALSNAMKRQDWWAPGQFHDCRAEYLGMILDRVNMKKVVGLL